MDKNQLIGLILISLLLLGYFYFNQDLQPPLQETPVPATQQTEPSPMAPPDTIKNVVVQKDSLNLVQQQEKYGNLASLTQGEAQDIILENEEVKITLSTKGGSVKEVLLKKYLTFDKRPLILLDENSTDISFLLNLGGIEIDLNDLYFQNMGATTDGDTTSLHLRAELDDGSSIDQYYALGESYGLRYNLQMPGLESSDPTTMARFQWKDKVKQLERGIEESRRKSAINYYLTDGSFHDVGDNSNDLEQEIIGQPVQWVTMKQKFFTAGIIPDMPFSGGSVSTQVASEADTSVVKDMQMVLNLPQNNLQNSGFTFYFGPNNYQVLKKVTEGFSKNVYLGWVVFAWINKWLIIPVFNFLEGYIASYGVIIIILAFFIKVILSPVSYKSYLSMAKMKVLKPQLDEIKEKFGDDMQKAQAEQMKLYGKVGVNPLSGCIPMVLQMPILLAMFNFFPNSIELRQAEFLWATDLSSYDSIMNLPFNIPFYGSHVSLFTLLMSASTLLYTWSNQQMNTTMQGPMKSMQYIMPVMMIFFFNNFSSGLTFYYFVLNILNFGQQAIIKKYFIDEEKILRIMMENKLKNKNKKKSKFQQRLEEAMKASEESKKNKK